MARRFKEERRRTEPAPEVETQKTRVTTTQSLSTEQMSRPSDWHPIDSSRLKMTRWDGGLGRIDVIFQDGTPWTYEVGQANYNLFKNFRRSASPGRYINRVLNNFPYHDAIGEFDGQEIAIEPEDDLA